MESFSVHTLRNWTQHRLLSLPKSPSQVPRHERCLLELCRLGMLLFSNLVIYPLPPAAGVGSKLSLDLRKTIDCITIHDLWPVYPDLLLWSTMLGAISANDGEDQLWYTTKLASTAVLTNTTGWYAAKRSSTRSCGGKGETASRTNSEWTRVVGCRLLELWPMMPL